MLAGSRTRVCAAYPPAAISMVNHSVSPLPCGGEPGTTSGVRTFMTKAGEVMDKGRSKTSTRPVVTIKDGMLRGRTQRTAEGNTYYSFQGIPYAKPPVGELRFKAPQPPERWTGVRDAGQEGNICCQPHVKVKVQPKSWSLKDVSAFLATMPTLLRRVGKLLRQSEDCLYLNVYTPELPRGETSPLRPVLFWIHGGGFIVGDGDEDVFGPEYFVDMGIVVVSINYRLGPFGFFSIGTEAAPGNFGLKDQSLALRWVRDNVTVFGGNPNRVTIYGESAGAVCAHLHTLSPMSRGLFHAVIAGSGSALHDWAVTKLQQGRAREFAKAMGIEATDPEGIVAALRKESAERLLRTTLKIKSEDRFFGHVLMFLPVVEPPGPDAFLSEHPEDLLTRGEQAPVPLMLGVNSCEGLLWYIGDPASGPPSHPESELRKLSQRRELFLPDDLYEALSAEQRAECHQEILQHYFRDSGMCKETIPQFLDLFGDVLFINRLHIVSRLHSAPGHAPVYVYHFSYEGKLGFFKRLLRIKHPGVSHGDELGYLFRCSILPDQHLSPDGPDIRCRKTLLKLWTNFIATGNPTPPSSVDDLKVTWMPATESNMNYLEIGDTLQMRTDRLGKRVEFWDCLYRKYMGVPILS